MSHYFINDNDIKSNEKKNKVFINEQSFSFWTDNGVFSKKGLDFGTRTLLESIPMNEMHGNVLDFGCGYGPIGITLAKQTDANIDMLDINERALNLTLKNIKENKVSANTILSNLYENINKKYDHIVSNPPIRVGKEILFKILFGAKEHLKENGKLWIVVNKNQGAKSLVKELENEYKVEIICKNKGFYIICATNN